VKTTMQLAQSQLMKLLETHERTSGMYVRIYGDHLIVGRRESFGPDGKLTDDDRVRLTRLNTSSYGLSVKRHTGRWERTPFSGTIQEMVETIHTFMQHLVASYS